MYIALPYDVKRQQPFGHMTTESLNLHSSTSFSEPVSNVILNQHQKSFPVVYNMKRNGEQTFFVHSDVMSRGHVTSQENWQWEDFHYGKNGKPTP